MRKIFRLKSGKFYMDFIASYVFFISLDKLRQASRDFKLIYLYELIKQNNSSGSLYMTNLNNYSKNDFFGNLASELYKTFKCNIKCGNLESSVNLVPAPLQFKG